jgi:hypothetical protein
MTSRTRTSLLWAAAVVITLAAAVFQRLTGPTHPVLGKTTFGDVTVSYRLDRSHAGPGDCQVKIPVPDDRFRGQIHCRAHKSTEEWRRVEMGLVNGELVGALPHQAPGGKLEYRVFLTREERTQAPGGLEIKGSSQPLHDAIPIRFRDPVPTIVMVPHILLMFAGMLTSNRAGIEALRREGSTRRLADFSFWLMVGGGMIIGPLVTWYSFHQLWTGIPVGWDITDSKTLIAVVAWLIPVIAARRSERAARRWALVAAITTFVVFMIPHSIS